MSYLTELHNTDTVITTNTEVTVENAVTEVLVDKENGYVAEAIPTNFTISSGGLYSGNLGGNAPQWLSDLVDSSVDATITDEYQTLLNTYETRIENTELGVAQEIVRAQNAEQSLSGLIASTKAELNGNISAVETIAASKVTPEEATNLIGTLVGSKWLAANEALAESYIDSRATTKVSEEFASNTTYNALVSSVNDPSTGLGATSAIQQESFTTVGLNPNGTLNAGAGELGRISASVNGLETTLTTVDTVNVDGVNWSIGASKLAQGPNGAITGWSFSDGSALNSQFKISADKFSLVNANGTATPLIVDATDPNNVQMEFTGKVTLAGLGIDSNTTTIDGGKIRTNTINADRIIAGTSMTAPLINGGTINGGTINGVNITGSVIKSSWIDYTSNGVLTNWQHFTPTTTPSTYVNNFAKDSTTGELIVDSLGYTRLPKVSGFVLSGYINSSYDPNTSYTFSKIYDIVPYDDYTVNNLNRPFNADVTFQVLGENVSSITLLSKFLDSYNGNGLSNTTVFTFYLGNTVVVVSSYWKFNSGAINTNNVTVSVNGANTYSGNAYSAAYNQNFGIFTLLIQPLYIMELSMSVSSQTITFSNFMLGNSSKFGVVIDATINDNNDAPISFNLPTLKEI